MNQFKLLGVTIDDNLMFTRFLSDTCANVNKKMFSIKRLFYLSHAVKVQFFKTFCLPYFDYCLSLSIYFTKTVLVRLCKCYYACLFRLFKFNFSNGDLSVINERLKIDGLLAFQYRIFYRLALFLFKNKTNDNAPLGIKSLLSIESRDLNYNLRQANQYMAIREENKYTKFILTNFFRNFSNIFSVHSFFSIDFNGFKKYFLNNISLLFCTFINKFKNFDINNCYLFFYY